MGIPAPAGVAAVGLPNAGDRATNAVSGSLSAVGTSPPIAIVGPMNIAIWASINTTLTTTANTTSASVGSGTGLAAGVAINSKNVPPGTIYGTFSSTSGNLSFPYVTLTGVINSAGLITGLASTAGLTGATVTVPSTQSGVTIPASTTVSAIVTAAIAPTAGNPQSTGSIQLSAVPTVIPNQNTPVPFQFALTNSSVTAGADSAATFTGAAIAWSGTVQIERSFDGGSTWIVANSGGTGTLAQYTAGPVSLSFGEPEQSVLYRLNCISYSSGTINYRISATGSAALSLALNQLS